MEVNRSGEMEVFARVVEAGSFSAAARRLNLTPSAVAKLCARLEARLGVRLINRSTRSLSLTEEGEAFYERASAILADIDEAESSIAAGAAAPRGRLRVNASVPFGMAVLTPLLPAFLARHPGVTLDLSLTDEVIDILGERSDVAIRHGPLKDSQLRARKLGSSRRLLVAAPGYLKRHGTPETPEDLAKHNCLNFNFRRSAYLWPLKTTAGEPLSVGGTVQVNNGETLRQLALAGLGIARLALFQIGEDLRRGRLVQLLEPFDREEREDIHAVFLGRAQMPARVRAFLDFLAERVRVE